MHNPLRSEAEMFRVVVIVVVAALPVIALGLIAGPGWGALVLGVEIGIGIVLLWRGVRGREPHTASVAAAEGGAHRVLVVANETVAGRALLDEIRSRCEGRECEVMIVVPAMTSSRLEYLADDVDGAIAEAGERLERSLAAISGAGLRVSGQVGDHYDPNEAIEDALRGFAADEVIISTHPPERSKWLERGVVERAERELPLPVTHVVVDLRAEGATAGSA